MSLHLKGCPSKQYNYTSLTPFLFFLYSALSACGVSGRLSAPIDIGHIHSPELREARYSSGVAIGLRGSNVTLLNNLSGAQPQLGRDLDDSKSEPVPAYDLNFNIAEHVQIFAGTNRDRLLLAGVVYQVAGEPLERSSAGNRPIAVSVSVGHDKSSAGEKTQSGLVLWYAQEACGCHWHADYNHYSLDGSVVAGVRGSHGFLLYGGPFLNLNFFDITLVREDANSAWKERTDYNRVLTTLGFSVAGEYSFGVQRRAFTSITTGSALMYWKDRGFSRRISSGALTVGWRF